MLTFQAAHGVALAGGLTWQIDDGLAQHLPFQTSDPEGVYAGMPVADDLFDALRRGTTLRTSFALAGRREMLTISVPLAQFAESSAEFLAAERQRQP
jgi:invasion protein IalB